MCHFVPFPEPRVKKSFKISGLRKDGGAEEDRTPDLRIANATLSQLSYRPVFKDFIDSHGLMQVVNQGDVAFLKSDPSR